MGKGKRYQGKKKALFKPNRKTKKKLEKEKGTLNKKTLFNRYKNKQKIENELEKKKQLEQRIHQRQPRYSESDVEEDVYDQLVSSLNVRTKRKEFGSYDECDDQNSNADVKTDNDVSMNNDTSIRSRDDKIEDSSDSELSAGDSPESSGYELNKRRSVSPEIINNDYESGMMQNLNDDDPFIVHLQYDLSDELVFSLTKSQPSVEISTTSWPVLGKIKITIPKPVEVASKKLKSKVTILEENIFATPGSIPNNIKCVNFEQLYIKSQIHGNIVAANKNNLVKRDIELNEKFTPLQRELFSIVNNYQDLYFPERTFINADEIRYIYCLHAVNHLLKTRTRILHHNAKLSKKSDLSEEYRDQGLTRPKVIILVPFKDAAYRVVKTIIDILVPKETGQVFNKNRFEDDFTGGELVMPKKNPKPEDYELMFSGNTDDTFRIGMTVTKKTLKLYSDFYSSDLIVASPLGLRMVVGAEGEEDRDFDFLASIEVLILDQADVFLMQNWDHLLHVLDHFHLQPKSTHNTDFSRVRSWAVNGWSKYYRQTLIFSSVLLPEIKSVLNKRCQNYAGKVIVENPVEIGSIQQVVLQVPQIFHRFNAQNPLLAVDARFEFFIKEILPSHRDSLMSHTLIYVPSYFDYVRIRNYFKKEDISFVQICEYSKDGKVARARDMFFHTEAHFLLYSERVHFFRRFRIKGIRHVIFYQLPTYPHLYSEMCNLMQEINQNKYGGSEFNMSVTSLYCPWDGARAAGVLGASRLAALARSDKTVHMYLTGV